MTSLAIAGEPGFEISLADAPASDNQPNYTLETLRVLRAGLPPDGSLFCLMGADSFVSLRRWRDAAEIPFVASLIVASRPGQQLDDLARFLPRGLTLEPCILAADASPPSVQIELRSYLVRNSAGQTVPFYLLPGLDVEISASDIRKQVPSTAQNPTAVRSPLPASVADYIRTNGLYR
jgi:nicotinate-nucleotide adenylyltransferase